MITKSEIALIRGLDKKKKRAESSLFLVEGEKMCEEVLQSGFSAYKLYFTAHSTSSVIGMARRKRVEVSEISGPQMERISHLKTPTTVLMLVRMPEYVLEAKSLASDLTLVLDDVQDPGNLGTIVRVADWFGIGNIICSPATADIYNPKALQATMGSVTRVKLHYLPLKETLAGLKSSGIPIYITSLDGKDVSALKEPPRHGLLVMGNEGNGVSAEISALADDSLFIPSFPRNSDSAESLNVGVATAIFCYLCRFL